MAAQVLTFENEQDWLSVRRRGIGGSDAAAVLGLSKWRTPLQVYWDKIGEGTPIPENEAMRWGKILEPAVRQEYAEVTGRAVLQPAGVLSKPDAPFMLASLDGFTEDERVVEIKTSRTGEGWGDAEDDVPTEYLLQVQHYMAVTGYNVTDLAVLIGGSDFRIYEIPADDELQALLVAHEAAFWECVEKQRPPEPISVSDLMNFYSVKPGNVLATPELSEIIGQLKKVKAELKDREVLKESLENEIKLALGERDALLTPDGKTLATWKQAKAPIRFDVEAFRDKYPRAYQKYCVEGTPSRRFLVK